MSMIPKVAACLDALVTIQRVRFLDERESHILLRELLTDEGASTMIVEMCRG
jgi:acetylglutamate kinase